VGLPLEEEGPGWGLYGAGGSLHLGRSEGVGKGTREAFQCVSSVILKSKQSQLRRESAEWFSRIAVFKPHLFFLFRAMT
jgi:hypothetical protein